MLEIRKFAMEATNNQDLQLHMGARVLSVVEQGAIVVLCIAENPDAPFTRRTVHIVETGRSFPDEVGEWQFVGTVKPHDWLLELHVFVGGEMTTNDRG